MTHVILVSAQVLLVLTLGLGTLEALRSSCELSWNMELHDTECMHLVESH